MAHIIQNKNKLLARISRIRGQINGIEKALNEERECGEILLTLAACRGAMNALMAEILVRQSLRNAHRELHPRSGLKVLTRNMVELRVTLAVVIAREFKIMRAPVN